MIQIQNQEYAALVGERDALSIKAAEATKLVVSLADLLEACLPTLKAAGWQIHNEQAVIARARKLTD